jgi:hypothetical protein
MIGRQCRTAIFLKDRNASGLYGLFASEERTTTLQMQRDCAHWWHRIDWLVRPWEYGLQIYLYLDGIKGDVSHLSGLSVVALPPTKRPKAKVRNTAGLRNQHRSIPENRVEQDQSITLNPSVVSHRNARKRINPQHLR